MLLAILSIGAVNAADDNNMSASDSIDNENAVNTEKIDVLGIVDDDDGDDDDDDDEDFENISDVSIDIPDTVEIGGGDDIDIELPEDAVGKIRITVDNQLWKTEDVNGEEDNIVSISLDSLKCGLHFVNVTFISSNSLYEDVSEAQWVNITYNITLSLDESYTVGETDNFVYISAPEEILLNITVFIDNKQYALVKESATRAYVNISSFEAGNYAVVAYFKGNSHYSEYSTSGTIIVVNGISVLDYYVSYNSEVFVSLKLPADAIGNLTLTVDGILIDSVKLINGYAKIKFPTSHVKIVRYTVEYTADDYEIDEVSSIVEIIPKVTVPTTMKVGEKKYITFDFDADASGYFDVEIDSEPFISNFRGNSLSLENLDDGEIDISIRYISDDMGYEYYFTIDVQSLPVKFVGISEIRMLYGDGSAYSFTVYGTNGKPLEEDDYVEIKIGKKEFEGYTNSKGVVNFKIPNNVLPGKYPVTFTYEDGDDVYTAKTNLIVKQSLSLKKASVKKSAKKLVLVAKLKKMNGKFLKGKVIIFKFNGKKYKAKTSSKGVAKVTIKSNVLSKLKAGKKITYQATYLKNTVKKSVKVKK